MQPFPINHFSSGATIKTMIPGFETIVEEMIKKAQKDGIFDNLDGTGKPLNFEDANVPEELRLAHKILKNSGFLPPEVELKKKITQTEQLLEGIGNGAPEREKIKKKLNYLLTKLATMRGETSSKFINPYKENIIKKLS